MMTENAFEGHGGDPVGRYQLNAYLAGMPFGRYQFTRNDILGRLRVHGDYFARELRARIADPTTTAEMRSDLISLLLEA